MASLPFACFDSQVPVGEIEDGKVDGKYIQRKALAATGRCRIRPEAYGGAAFRAVVDKNREQALVVDVNDDDPEKKKANKQLRKKYMKQGVAMASSLLRETLQLDVSIVRVEIIVAAKDIIETDGCIAACFLDAGCDRLVVDMNEADATTALDAAKIPRERLVAHYKDAESATPASIEESLKLVDTISVTLGGESSEKAMGSVDEFLGLVSDKKDKLTFVIGKDLATLLYHDSDDFTSPLTDLVSGISKKCKDGKGNVGIIDPTSTQLGSSFAACLRTDRPDGLFTTVVCSRSGEALGLVYSSKESIVAALDCGRGVYYSRSRNGLWHKGDTSGHFQTLHRLDVDCDGDALRFTVTQRSGPEESPAFCHLKTLTCWGEPVGLRHLEETLRERLVSAPEGSYTKRLFEDEELLRDKLVEEAQELAEATEPDDVAGELADVMYFAMVRAVKAGVSIDDAIAELDRRTRKVTRRQGDSKAFRIAAGEAILKKNEAEG